MRLDRKERRSTKLAGLRVIASVIACAALAGCSIPPPKYENGQYIPPSAQHALAITLESESCAGGMAVMAPVPVALVSAVVPVLTNYGYDQLVNWLDNKAANLSASSSGVATATLYERRGDDAALKRCLRLTRGDTLVAEFDLEPTGQAYWHMTPHSLDFRKSEAKEGRDEEKSLVADIAFATPGADGKLITFFQGTFNLGQRTAGSGKIVQFVGQDSGPIVFPKPDEKDPSLTMKITASIVEHGEGRDWIRAVTNSLREKEHRDQILKPILDAIGKAAGGR